MQVIGEEFNFPLRWKANNRTTDGEGARSFEPVEHLLIGYPVNATRTRADRQRGSCGAGCFINPSMTMHGVLL